MKKVIFFDLDYTLYDSQAFIEGKIDAYTQRFGLDKAFVEEKEQETAEEILAHYGKFIHEEYAKTLAQRLGIPKRWKQILEISFEETLHNEALYAESKTVLEKLKRDFELGLFSQGDLDLQRAKLEKTGLQNYFNADMVLIFGEKTSKIPEIAQKYQVFAVLDDKPEVVDAWSRADVLAIRVRRGVYFMTDLLEKRPNISEVENLQQAYKLLRSKLPQYF